MPINDRNENKFQTKRISSSHIGRAAYRSSENIFLAHDSIAHTVAVIFLRVCIFL